MKCINCTYLQKELEHYWGTRIKPQNTVQYNEPEGVYRRDIV